LETVLSGSRLEKTTAGFEVLRRKNPKPVIIIT
jgi:hypothetical protein